MNSDQMVAEIGLSAMATFALAGPLLILAAVIGLLIAVFQAATQIQEQTIAQIIKIGLISAALLFFGRMLSTPLVEHSIRILNDFPTMVR